MIRHPAFPQEVWSIRETELDSAFLPQTESIFALANGHLGLRGNLDEGEPRGLTGTYLNGFYESFPLGYGERGFGWPEDGQAVVPVTEGKVVRLLVEDEPFDVHRGALEHHERVLDLRSGTLTRDVRWRSEYGRAVRVRTQRLVSFRERSLAAILYEVEALEQPLRVALQSNLVANQPDRPGGADPRAGRSLGAVLEPLLAVSHEERVVLGHRTRRSGLALAAGMDHVVLTEGDVSTLTQTEPDLGRVTMSVELQPGRPLRLVKYVAYHWSSQQSIEWLRDQVDASLENAVAQGYENVCEGQRSFLDAWWEVADIELDGDLAIQQALRFASFHLLQASARIEGRAIPAKGLTGPGYDGHAFWDSEAFVLPLLTYTQPQLAREALRWRHATLPAARERAEQLGLQGASLPWRTIRGEECSGYWPAGSAAFHVNAGVAAAVARYSAVTGDAAFDATCGLELLVETARLWRSLGHMGTDARFRIDGVTGPDEYSALVDNNVYTNLMAQLNLRAAAQCAARNEAQAAELGVTAEEIASWTEAADAMYIPYDEARGVHPQDQDFLDHEVWDFANTAPGDYPLLLHAPYLQLYRKQIVKQPDLVLALFARGNAFTAEERARNFAYYESITVRDSSLSACTHAIVAAEVGHLQLAYDYLAEAALMDLEDKEHNASDGVHIASLGGALLAAVSGLAGFRDHAGHLTFAPWLPRGLTRLAFSMAVGDARLEVEVQPREASYRLATGTALEIRHWGERVHVHGTAPQVRPIPPVPEVEPVHQPPGREPRRHAPS